MRITVKTLVGLSAAFLLSTVDGRAMTPAPSAGTMEVTVETYNILGKQHAHKSPWEPRRQYVGELILQEDNSPDIIGLQECTDPSQYGDMIGMLCAEYDWAIGENRYMSSRAMFWKRERFELVESYLVDMLEGRYPEMYRGSRYAHCIRLREKQTGHELTVYNLHLRAGSTPEVVALRKECVESLCPIAKRRSEELGGVPVIILGDMNNHPGSSPHGIPGAPLVFAEHGFLDSFLMTDNRVNQDYNSYNTQQNVDECTVSPNGPGGSKRIDYIFGWPAGRFASSEHAVVINFRGDSKVDVRCPLPSDHNPVRSKLTISYHDTPSNESN